MKPSPFHLPPEMTIGDFSRAFDIPHGRVYSKAVITSRLNKEYLIDNVLTFASVHLLGFKKWDSDPRYCLKCKTILSNDCFAKKYNLDLTTGIRKSKPLCTPSCRECENKASAKRLRDKYQSSQAFRDSEAVRRKNNSVQIKKNRNNRYKKNPKPFKDSTKRWKLANKDKVTSQRIRRAGLKAEVLEKTDMANLKKTKCYYCGKRLRGRYHIDHITPLSKGGVHAYYNLCAACPTCNMRKSAKDVNDFIEEGQLELTL